MNADALPVFDADGHVLEDMLDMYEFLEPPYNRGVIVDRAIKRGHSLWPQLDGFPRQALAARMEASSGWTTEWWTTADQWTSVLDETGVGGTVLYPTAGLAHGIIRDAEWAVALAKAYNDWIAHRYRQVDDRLQFVALLALQDPVSAAAELRRAVVELGAVGGVLAGAGLNKPLGAPELFPLYEAAQELDVPLVVHGGPAAVLPDIYDNFTHIHVLHHPVFQMISMTSMFKGGVFDRFRKLRVGYFEAGAAWVPFLLARLDRTTEYVGYQPYSVYATDEEPQLPSEVIRAGRVFFSVEGEEPLLPHVLDGLGDHCLCFASDYPHEQGDAKALLREAGEISGRDDISDAQKAGILNDNAFRLYATLRAKDGR